MRKWIKISIFALLLTVALYGAGRLYYAVTGGFTLSNITSTLPYDERWQIKTPSAQQQFIINDALNQEYTYLGKGCQSYVFISRDGQYVIKFLKYQRFRPQMWIDLFTFIPAVERYQNQKTLEKQEKLEKVFRSWKLAYEQLQEQTGVIYVHLNKVPMNGKKLAIRDKMNFKHQIDLENTEFLVQKRAEMFAPTIQRMMKVGDANRAKRLLDKLLILLLFEYMRGIADNDHALMQNTGVMNKEPIHIDVGQFIVNDIVKDPKVYHREIFDKTYRLREWLQKHYPELADHLINRLFAIIEVDYFYMPPFVYRGDVGKIPYQD